jgi:hypothetical protein
MKLKDYIVPIFLLLVVPIFPWFTGLKVGGDTCNTLFCAAGVLFSVSMSLIIAFNSKGVTDDDVKSDLRKNMHNIRDVLIGYFVISLIGIVLLKHIREGYDVAICEYNICINFNFKLGYTCFIAWYFLVLLVNYKKIHKNYEKQEDCE